MNGLQRRARLDDAVLYLCVDRREQQNDLEAFLDAELGAGVDLVQLRDKTATPDELRSASEIFRRAADRAGALFILNDEPDLSVEVGADGVHVGQDDLHPDLARAIVGEEAIVGWSTHAIVEIDAALNTGADYFAVGPVHATPTKQGRPGIGLAPITYAAQVASGRPWFVTGAMSVDTAPQVLAAGAQRLVVVRALTQADDPAAVTRQLADLLRR